MAAKVYYRQSLTGGGATVLDGVAYAGLSDGDIAFVFTGSTMYTYYFEDSSTATESSPDVITPDDAAGNGRWLLQAVSVPEESAGVIKMYGGSSLPSGYLLCDGSAVSRTTYADLYSAIGTTHGSGDGSTTFNVPDLRGRVPVGLDNMGGVSANRVTATAADSLGGTSGAETHTLTTTEIPAHAHDSKLTAYSNNANLAATGAGSDDVPQSYKSGTFDTENAGGGGAHNNMQPYMAINYIIRT